MKKYLIIVFLVGIIQTIQSQQKNHPLSNSVHSTKILSGEEVCKQLLLKFEKANVPQILDLFTEDAIIRFPFAGVLGAPEVYEGTKAYGDQISRVYSAIVDFKFFDVRITPSLDKNIFWIESKAKGTFFASQKGGKEEVYEQKYVMKLHIKKGKIFDYTEYWNPVPIMEHMNKINSDKK